ncbi:MAG: rim15, signal transduction response regulator [Thelocarpon superellum]|nr:MAG: rim15, signal transduction response regulator [Thelocarpon superellum]
MDALAPPAVTALKEEASQNAPPIQGQMERTMSQDIQEEREDLKEAAEQNLNVILDVSLDGVVRWVSPSWEEVVGTPPELVRGRLIADLVLDHKTAFTEAVESMKQDGSRSQRLRVSVLMGPASKLAPEPLDPTTPREAPEDQGAEQMGEADTLILEGQGIMVYDRETGAESHTMWMLRPSVEPREVTMDLPSLLVESLGVGAEVLAGYLTALTEPGPEDQGPANVTPPAPVLCRICERHVPPWWFEKHTELCMQEHRAEMEVQLAHEALTEHRNLIVKVLEGLEARTGRPTSGEIAVMVAPQPEYKGMPIGSSTNQSSNTSGTASPLASRARSRDKSPSPLGHTRARSIALRRPLSRVVEIVLDLCDTAIEVNTPAIKDTQDPAEAIRTQSPTSEANVSQVLTWQKPSTATLDQEPGLAALCADTEAATRAKIDAVLRHRRILEYSERIRVEFSLLVQELIDEAMHKASEIQGDAHEAERDREEDEDTEEAEEEEDDEAEDGGSVNHEEPAMFAGSFDGSSSLARALRQVSESSLSVRGGRRPSASPSARSSSPRESATPRSLRDSISIHQAGHPSLRSKRSSMYFESDAGDSDGSVRSPIMFDSRRTESPRPDATIRRATSTRDRHRRSIALSGTSSPHRQQSPGRVMPPPSPLRMGKPPFGEVLDAIHSPLTSPVLGSELASPAGLVLHHKRQSSTTTSASTDVRPPLSPRLMTSQPQAKAVAPSIKDFEIIKPISKGAFGSVYLSKKKSTGDYFAIKVLKKADMVAKNQVTNVKAERAIMMWQGESDFVAKLYWTFSSKEYLYLVMEYLNGGDCASLTKVLGGLPEHWAKKYLAEVVLGLEHLHGRGIVHRDLKPDNLLIDQTGHLKLTDFGLSRMGLIGRQKRVLENQANDSAPDLLKQGPFAVPPASVASSRSTSFDMQGHPSPVSTPQMTPDLGRGGFPSYFTLGREKSVGREHSGHASGHRSDSGGSESLHAMLGNFTLSDPIPAPAGPPRRSASEEESQPYSDGSGSPETWSLHHAHSHTSVTLDVAPPTSAATPSMMPPPMALFDPEDSTRRFVGTPDYLAPETINGVGQDEMSDWWSLGCILFEFLYGYPPFHANTPEQVFSNILERKIDWPEEDAMPVSAEAKDLMNRLMCLNPQERLGANAHDRFSCGGEEVQRHPWFHDINWDTLLQDEAQFVPASDDPENTEYFDARGATLQAFAEEEATSSPADTPGAEMPTRPHDVLSKVRTHVNSIKRTLMPLHIPSHVRESRSRRLSEPVGADDFGSFAFKNLPVLEKANKDVIQKLRAEAMQAQVKNLPTGTTSAGPSPAPSLENSPVLPMTLKRQISTSKSNNRPASPSAMSQAGSSPSRVSQPSSPLLITFTSGPTGERRKTSSTSSLQPGSLFEAPRLTSGSKMAGLATSPIKQGRATVPLITSPQKALPPRSGPVSRARSHTVGSQDGESPAKERFVDQKRRSGVFDMSPSSSDNEDTRTNALLRVQRRRQSSRRLSQINVNEGPIFRPLDVLICEDHPVSRLVMEALLEKLRCRTITVGNGDEATRFAMSDVKFDIIMMEFKLPRINGADVARMIRDTKNVNSQTPIVAVTGYLKELQAPHHFDAMIEKPPTVGKLTEVMSRLCHWKPLPPGVYPTYPTGVPGSGLRQESVRSEDSPSSASSGFAHMPGTTFRGSSREDSISSSFFGDADSIVAEEMPVIINRHPDDWAETGLGISEEALTETKAPPHLVQQQSAPAALPSKPLERQRSTEKIRTKRDGVHLKRFQGGESGDDEDEELGNVRSRSPHSRAQRSSRLGVEMMRTNSRGSVVSTSDVSLPAPDRTKADEEERELCATITPPEIFPRAPGDTVADVAMDIDATPKAPKLGSMHSDDATP